MAKTLLTCVNDVLKRVGQVHGDSAALTTLTSQSRQRAIDIAVQVINEGIDELYATRDKPKPLEQAESTITLVADDRDYSLASDLVQLHFPLIDKTNNQYIREFPGDYNKMLRWDPEQDNTGLPHYAVISPVDGTLYLDRAPTANEAGRVYTYQYHKELELVAASDTVPFGNTVYRAMRPVWAQLWRREIENDFDAALFAQNMGRAARLVSQTEASDNYNPRRC